MHHQFQIIIPPQNIECHPRYLKKIAEGDATAFECLYKNYCGRLYDYVYLLTRDPYMSEDVVHDVFIKIWNNRQSMLNVKNINAYLFTTAKNHFLNIQKAKTTERASLAAWKHRQCSSVDVRPLEEKETKELIAKGFSSLTERQQLFFYLTREKEVSHRNISKEYGVSLNTVKNIIVSANKRLKEFLEVR